MTHIAGLATVVVGVALALGAETAESEPVFTTNYSYYGISGGTSTGIFASLLQNLQHLRGGRFHAYTSINIPVPKTVKTATGCQVGRLSVNFLIRLPKHRNEAALSASDRRLWRQFSTFIRKHEETHRAFWMGCARSMDAKLASLRGNNCDEVARQARNVIEQGKPNCRRKDIAFDAAETRRLDRHPFMKAAVAPIYTPLRGKSVKGRKATSLPAAR